MLTRSGRGTLGEPESADTPMTVKPSPAPHPSSVDDDGEEIAILPPVEGLGAPQAEGGDEPQADFEDESQTEGEDMPRFEGEDPDEEVPKESEGDPTPAAAPPVPPFGRPRFAFKAPPPPGSSPPVKSRRSQALWPEGTPWEGRPPVAPLPAPGETRRGSLALDFTSSLNPDAPEWYPLREETVMDPPIDPEPSLLSTTGRIKL